MTNNNWSPLVQKEASSELVDKDLQRQANDNTLFRPYLLKIQMFFSEDTLLREGTHFHCWANIAIYLQTTGAGGLSL